VIAALVRADGLLYRAERALAALLLASMGLVVFLDVAQRVSTRAGSWLASPFAVGAVAFVLIALALHTRDAEKLFIRAAVWTAAFVAARWFFLFLLPNGLVWSQTFALALTLWLGLLGASLAAHERRHLALDVGSRIWPPSLAPKIAAIGHLVTAGFCALLLVLGLRSVDAHWELWTSTEHAAGNLSGLPIPKWFPAGAIVYGMFVLAFRFFLEGVRTWTGDLKSGADDTLHQLGIDAEGGALGTRP
jgi:TRAP-type C4-dicarboxylate transport system permease small subunit